jgi:hypothetical protein
MSHINEKLGLRPAGARARLNALSGVACPRCPHHDVSSNIVHRELWWRCGWCSHGWHPTDEEIAAYNDRVRDRDHVSRSGR